MISRETVLNGSAAVKPLCEVVDFLDNIRKPVRESERVPGDYPYYGANGIQGTIDGYLFDEPLILLAEDGGHFGNPNKTIAYKVDGKCWVNNHAHVLRCKKGIDRSYLCRQLERYDVRPFVSGTTRGKLTKGSASKIPILLPDISEQKRIATVLDKADDIRIKREESLRLADEFLKSVYVDMFGDSVSNPKGWDTAPLKEVATKIQIGPFGSQLHKEDYITGGIPLINPMHIVSGKIVADTKYSISKAKYDSLPNYHLEVGDVIMGRRGEMGRCAEVKDTKERLFCGTGSLYIRPSSSVTSAFLVDVLSSSSMKAHLEDRARGITMANLNKTIVGNLLIPLPPIELQRMYQQIRAKHCEYLSKLNAYEKHMSNLLGALNSNAFKGRL